MSKRRAAQHGESHFATGPPTALRSHHEEPSLSPEEDGVQERKRKGVSGRPPISEPPWNVGEVQGVAVTSTKASWPLCS